MENQDKILKNIGINSKISNIQYPISNIQYPISNIIKEQLFIFSSITLL
ncbi:hypothetical protein P0082_10340 [Candidatus Haliotispira prima]|uniref:Uncharacterized protein n=1 Tax=Candidatus Haliotispira prima TaxID=3034016 RepID=A0ABY8MFX2_9SPIO|nr:hypothetical protein P0082_10340 [Candidatus Haliotispira prima]